MSKEIWFCSDLHLGHSNMYNFIDYDGNRVRPFDDWRECDELMIQNWNEMIKPNDKVYVLGDLCFDRNAGDKIMPRLNGKKCLVKGNHDKFKLSWYCKWFYDIRGGEHLENFFYTHVPIHPDSKARFKMNIHGHLHRGLVYKHNKHGEITKIPDPWYRNVCMDANDYKPVPFEVIQHEFGVYKQRGEIIIPNKTIR